MIKEPVKIDNSLCLVCGCCVGVCPLNAMKLTDTRLVIDDQICSRCERCIDLCPAGALSILRKAAAK